MPAMKKAADRASAPLGVTMGCPASIGPEIIIRYHLDRQAGQAAPVVVVGDLGVLQAGAAALGVRVEAIPWQPGSTPDETALNVYCVSTLDKDRFSFGSPTPATGAAMARYVETAIELCRTRRLAGLVTGPISKSSLALAGQPFPGHTEMLAERTGTPQVAMMLAGATLKVVPATIHCPLCRVAENLERKTLSSLLLLVIRCLREDFGVASPRVAVAGLNPHAGEAGLFGVEEETIIAPAIAAAAERCGPSAAISGPHSPDTVFYRARQGAYDVVVAMYHDQGLIPFKLLHFDDGVNVTLGLPFVRTSVDHGTAYDIAGRGIASHASLAAAIDLARILVANRDGRPAGNGV